MAPAAEPADAVLFAGVSLVLGITCRHLLHGTRVPYTVALLILGVALGWLEFGTSCGLGKLGAGIRIWADINPDLLLAVFLPALLFESSFSMETHQIKRCMAQMLLLAGPGVIISTCILGTAIKITFPYNWNWKTALLLGGLLSATDPVAVVAYLKDLGASKKLSTLIEGESLMNDAVSIVVFQLFYRMALGGSFNAGSIIVFLTEVSLGSVALGLVFGLLLLLWLRFIFNDTIIEMTLTLVVSYIAFFTAQDALGISGILTVMILGMFYAAFGKTASKGDNQQSLHHFWELVAYVANTLIFILSGVVIADGVLQYGTHFENHGTSWGFLLLLYVFVQISRVVVVCLFYPLLRYFGYGLDLKEATILVWSGLRGAVSLSLSLSVKHAGDTAQSFLEPEVGIMFVFFTGGIVFLTLVLNGSTTQFLLHLFGMGKLSAMKLRMLNYTRYEMLKKALEAFVDLRGDEELGPVDWVTVKKNITLLNNLGDDHVHPHADEDYHMYAMNLKDIRVRLLNGVQATYRDMIEEGWITEATANVLMRSVDEAMDLVSSQPLCDWKVLRSSVHFPVYYRFLQSWLPQRLITYFAVQRMEAGCYICAAFLRAHRIAQRQLHDFLGDSVIARTVISESNAEQEEARIFLEDVRVTFPQVLSSLKTSQVTYSVLTHMNQHIRNLRKTGLLEEKEMVHLDDALQTDLKKLKCNPPLVKMSRVGDLLYAHPVVSILSSAVRDHLLSNAKETVNEYGPLLYREGSGATGVWFVSIGVEKWTIQRQLVDSSRGQSSDPVLLHGSTLGLYEVLTGNPYICDMIMDPVMHYFFIEAETIQQLRHSDPSFEAFLWQEAMESFCYRICTRLLHSDRNKIRLESYEKPITESALVIARLFIPGIFEKLAMHEMRLLIAETSSVNGVYNVGEDIILEHNYVGILLEGNLRTKDQNMIASPGVLLPSNIHSNFAQNSSAMVNYCASPSYQVEARVRIIFLKTGRQQANQQRGSSSISQIRSNTGSCPAPLDTRLEEIIVTVDSPNNLSLSQSSGAPRGS